MISIRSMIPPAVSRTLRPPFVPKSHLSMRTIRHDVDSGRYGLFRFASQLTGNRPVDSPVVLVDPFWPPFMEKNEFAMIDTE